jgi:hypothetical protein
MIPGIWESLTEKDLRSPRLLDLWRERQHAWSLTLWDEEHGGFRPRPDAPATLMGSADVAWIRYANGDPDLPAPGRERWVEFLIRCQDPVTGRVRHAQGDYFDAFAFGHAFWKFARALRILGTEVPRCPRHFRALLTPAGLAGWFAATDWDSHRGSNHHEVLGLVPILASRDDPALVQALLNELAAQQHPQRGTWPIAALNLSRTFAYTALYCALGRLPAWPERIVDATLEQQRPDGFWGDDMRYLTMDALYLLARLPPRIRHREAEARAAIERTADVVLARLAAQQERIAGHLDHMLAVTHILGLIQEVLPDRFPSSPRYRFDWDLPTLYRSRAIAEAEAITTWTH